MKRDRYALMIVFAQGPTFAGVFRGRSLRRRIRMLRKAPTVMYQILGAALCGFFMRSQHRHILVGDSRWMLNYTFREVFAHKYEDVASRMHVMGWIYIPVDTVPNLRCIEGMKKRTFLYATLGRILMGLTAGLYQCENCTTMTRDVLRHHGVDVPRRCWNPKRLLLWMTEHGYDFTSGSPPP